MSFFGFDTKLPRDRGLQPSPRGQHSSSRGMFDQHDPFAEITKGAAADGGEVLNFEDTYDGLGDNIDEAGDAFNDDTFGGGPATRESMVKDFDFAGQTAAARGPLLQERSKYQPQKPKTTGYESYKNDDYIPKLEADASIWGKPKPELQLQQQLGRQESRKMMSLEEVEAIMRAQSRPQSGGVNHDASLALKNMIGIGSSQPEPAFEQQQQSVPQILRRPPPKVESGYYQSSHAPQLVPEAHSPFFPQAQPQPQGQPDYALRAPQILQRQLSPQPPRPRSEGFQGPPQMQQPSIPPPIQQIQGMQGQLPQIPMGNLAHSRGPSYNGPPITQAQQLMQMAPDEREAYLAEEAKRAKRNHKIFLLSKNNGIMTPQDKNFITRIQLQQLLTATGGVEADAGPEGQLAEDFYYQVYSQIRGGPNQQGNTFAQTYLFQTGGRYGNRRHPRGGDNHIQRMEQQVARAVEAAKARPKHKQLIVEGSLGKVTFSSSKTPRPLLNFKRPDSEARMRTHPKPESVADRKKVLRDIESVYTSLMEMEDHERRMPPPLQEESSPDHIQAHMEWRQRIQELNGKLWVSLKVHEPIQDNPSIPHPFIAILSYSKGKRVIPRVFRHLDDQQRLTMLTLIAIHLDQLDVIRNAYSPADGTPIPPQVREEIELFTQAVMPALFSYVNESPLNIIIGLLGLILERVNVQAIIRTKIGVSVLTMLISRAELVKQQTSSTANNNDDWNEWTALYARLFDLAEPVLPYIFGNEPVTSGNDVHVWQWLAAMGVGASPDQQQRLVLGVKDRVMETVGVAKTLPRAMSESRLGDVNLFMRAIGLDVELLG